MEKYTETFDGLGELTLLNIWQGHYAVPTDGQEIDRWANCLFQEVLHSPEAIHCKYDVWLYSAIDFDGSTRDCEGINVMCPQAVAEVWKSVCDRIGAECEQLNRRVAHGQRYGDCDRKGITVVRLPDGKVRWVEGYLEDEEIDNWMEVNSL